MSDEKALTVASLGDTVRDSVRLAMMKAIPDEALNKLIEAEFDNFFKDTQRNYSSDDVRSPFKRMVGSEINKQMENRVREIVNNAVHNFLIEKDGDDSKLTKDIVAMVTPAVFESLMGNVANHVVNNLKQQINNGRVY